MLSVNNILTPEELTLIKNAIKEKPGEIDNTLGRYSMGIHEYFTDAMKAKFNDIAKQASGIALKMHHGMSTTYSAEYGNPNLPPHFDGDTNDLIINMQLEANTEWPLGLNMDTYTLEDNSALVFNANTEIHWRVHKEFKEGEYVTMLFVRFFNEENPSDYSHLPMHPSDSVFDEVRKLRDSLI
jgi:hypothetical protein